jgi:hypothetical protein
MARAAAARPAGDGEAGEPLPGGVTPHRTHRPLPDDVVFAESVRHLAHTESTATFGLPARTFDARPKLAREPGKPLITAWGAFQFNRDAWRALPETASDAFPWQCTPCEEIGWPLRKYARLFQEIRGAGGGDLAAARGLRLWHRAPGAYRAYVRRGRQVGFQRAWMDVEPRHREVVETRLKMNARLAALWPTRSR